MTKKKAFCVRFFDDSTVEIHRGTTMLTRCGEDGSEHARIFSLAYAKATNGIFLPIVERWKTPSHSQLGVILTMSVKDLAEARCTSAATVNYLTFDSTTHQMQDAATKIAAICELDVCDVRILGPDDSVDATQDCCVFLTDNTIDDLENNPSVMLGRLHSILVRIPRATVLYQNGNISTLQSFINLVSARVAEMTGNVDMAGNLISDEPEGP